MITKIVSITVCMFSLIHLTASETWKAGNESYKNGDYTQAIASYQQLLEEGLSSAELYHNLGAAYFVEGEIGESILFLEKAVRLRPSDNNIQSSLSVSRESVDSPFIEIPEFFITRYWKVLCASLPSFLWLILQVISGGIGIYGIYNWQLSQDKDKRYRGFILGLAGLLLSIVLFFVSRSSSRLDTSHDIAIVMDNLTLMSGPDQRSEQKENLPEGLKVQILDQIDDWYKVSLSNRDIGWVEKDKLGVI